MLNKSKNKNKNGKRLARKINKNKKERIPYVQNVKVHQKRYKKKRRK